MVILLVLIASVLQQTSGACKFTYNFQITVHKGKEWYHDQSLTGNRDNLTVSFPVGDSITVKCVTGYQFVNAIRKINGVNTFDMDQGVGIKVSCILGDVMSPDISVDTLDNSRYLFCNAGCAPVREDKYKVTYTDALVTSEDGSPPIRALQSSIIFLACQPGYTISTGTIGNSYPGCEKDSIENTVDWLPTKANFINCVRGCPDITKSVQNGQTTDVPNTTLNAAPFKPGDTVTFSCEAGYVLVGYPVLTCTGLLEWNESVPECVKV